MKIALLTYSTKPRGGVVHTLALAEALAELGQDVHVWTLGRDGDGGFFRTVAGAVTQHLVAFPALDAESVGERILRSIRVLGAAFDPAGYDVVHAQDCISANAVALSGARSCVRTIHHLDQFSTPELAACHERAIVEPAAHLCVSAAVAAEVEAGWGLRPTVIGNGVDAARFATVEASMVTDWQREIGAPYLLAVGGIEPRKGTVDLAAAFDSLRRRDRGRYAGLRLVLAGGETLFDYRDYRAEFDRLCRDRGVDPIILGPVDHDRLPGLVAGAAAFGFVSTKEGFGLAAMEALAADVPVVVRDLPVLREVFGGHVRYGADVAALTEAFVSALQDGPLPGGAAFAATHSWADAARAHLGFYGDVLRPTVAVRTR